MIPDNLETERLKLRPFVDEDAQAVFDYWNSDSNWSRFNRSVPEDFTLSDTMKFVTDMVSRIREDQPNWAIVLEDEVVGIVSLTFEQDHRIAVIGYGVHDKVRGKGYATAASKLVINQAFETYPKLRKIRAHTDARNAGSIRVLQKLGFSREGVLRSNQYVKGEFVDEAIYGLLREDWSVIGS